MPIKINWKYLYNKGDYLGAYSTLEPSKERNIETEYIVIEENRKDLCNKGDIYKVYPFSRCGSEDGWKPYILYLKYSLFETRKEAEEYSDRIILGTKYIRA